MKNIEDEIEKIHIQRSCIKPYTYAAKPAKAAKFGGQAKVVTAVAVETGIGPNGEKAGPAAVAANSSGFGGLGLEGMVGTDETVGVGKTPPGEGRSGVISGDSC
uniref:Uncharacterized protein n=1 Tax=Cannabis sativa TaxID=3483 RepID=A0A803Q592_CANSA